MLLSLLLALALPAFATRPLTPPAPEFPAGDAWLNSQPFSLKQLKGRRAVLVAFINMANVNSLRSLTVLKALDEQYGLSGLMVIGVHTPEYGFQKDPAAVRLALRREHVTFPVVLDNDRAIWKAYRNDGWPEFYLIDRRGLIVYDHLGEDRYSELESELQHAIADVSGYPPEQDKPFVLSDGPAVGCGTATPEVDAKRAAGKIVDLDATEVPDTMVLIAQRQGELSTRGRWLLGDGLRLDQRNRDLGAFVRIIYVGTQALATLAPGPRAPAKFWVRQDDLWLSGNAGRDVQFDDEGRSYVLVDAPRMYRLVENANDEPHELTLLPEQDGSVVYSWSFSDKCLKYER